MTGIKNDVFTPSHKVRVVVGVVVMLLIAAIHGFRLGSYLNGDLYIFYYSYASDLMLPFGAYFMLTMNEVQLKFLRKWSVKAGIVFGVMSLSEVMQFFDIYLLGVTFDIVDILMYGIGTLCAVFFDRQVFVWLIPGWQFNEAKF